MVRSRGPLIPANAGISSNESGILSQQIPACAGMSGRQVLVIWGSAVNSKRREQSKDPV